MHRGLTYGRERIAPNTRSCLIECWHWQHFGRCANGSELVVEFVGWLSTLFFA